MCWGYNNNGQLGNGSFTQSTTPIAVNGLGSVKSISAGFYHTCAVLDNGSAMCWGYNNNGQLGDGTITRRTSPVAVNGLGSVNSISAGGNHNGSHTCALLDNGSAMCWGYNNNGQLGNGSSGTDNATPGTVINLSNIRLHGINQSHAVTNVDNGTAPTARYGETLSAGANYTCTVLDNGSAKCWGSNSNGQLGNGGPLPGTDNSTPGNVVNISNFRSISTSLRKDETHTCAVLDNGSAMCWGSNSNGQLGNGSSLPGNDIATPGTVTGLQSVKSISVGGTHTCAVLDNGYAMCWGKNDYGQLGNGSLGSGTDNATPGAVTGLQSVKSISASYYHTCAVLDNGSAMCWGKNDYGQLGNESSGTGTDNATPGIVTGLQSVKSISAGGHHTCTVLDNGSAMCWGRNNRGQLGYGTSTTTTPGIVTGLQSVKSISAGFSHTCAVLDNSSAMCWGNNNDGQLGISTSTTQSNTPIAVNTLGLVKSISAGGHNNGAHTCASLDNGSAMCWGRNDRGQLGNGTTNTTPNATPGTVINLTNIRLP